MPVNAKQLLDMGLEHARVREDFPHLTWLEVPLNDPELHPDTEYHTVAELSFEDSGYGPLLWAFAIGRLKELKKEGCCDA